MRLACWNVLDENADAARILRFLDDAVPTLAALQEVTAEHVAALRAAGWSVCVGEDFARGTSVRYLAFASRRPVRWYRVRPINADRTISPSVVGRRMGWAECLAFLIAGWDGGDVGVDGTEVALACVHLSCAAPPRQRSRECEAILSALPPGRPAIVMGDFNAFGRPWLSPLVAPAFGLGWRDLVRHELRDLRTAAHRHGLGPIVDGVTYPRFRLQLDQVLVRGVAVERVEVVPDPYGSDHRPILVDIGPSAGTVDPTP